MKKYSLLFIVTFVCLALFQNCGPEDKLNTQSQKLCFSNSTSGGTHVGDPMNCDGQNLQKGSNIFHKPFYIQSVSNPVNPDPNVFSVEMCARTAFVYKEGSLDIAVGYNHVFVLNREGGFLANASNLQFSVENLDVIQANANSLSGSWALADTCQSGSSIKLTNQYGSYSSNVASRRNYKMDVSAVIIDPETVVFTFDTQPLIDKLIHVQSHNDLLLYLDGEF